MRRRSTRTPARALLVAPLAAAVLLSGCASNDPRDRVRSGVEDVVNAANDRDAVAVRLAVDALLTTLREQTASKDLTPQEASRVADAARAVAESAGLLEAVPSPVPTVEVTSEPVPSPTREPSPTPEPTEAPPSPSPSPSPEPAQTTTPPIVEVSPAVVQTQSAPAPSPSPASAQLQSSPAPSSPPA